MPSIKASYNVITVIGSLLFLTTCSVEKNTPATRFYQGMTAKYNIYFNGYESFKAGVQKVVNGYRDDYAELLNVFEYSDPTSPSRCASDMDRAIMKASKLITLKSITARPEIKGKESAAETDLLSRKEFNDWVDDSYLLIGEAHFYKHEYNEASSVFNYCITEANDPEIKQEASIWLARISNETGLYSDSYRTLAELDPGKDSPKRIKSMYYTTLADLFIKQKKYSDATGPLAEATDFVSGKRSRYRLTYLLAQLNELTGNSPEAVLLYRKVVKMNPPYDVEFNARINIAGVFDPESGKPEDLGRELEKMLRNAKNKDFHDQVYYALGNLSMKEGNEKEAIDFYNRSVRSSSGNRNQKGRSFLALADYYFKKNDFLNSGLYYDSTVLFLDRNHPDFTKLKLKSQNLNSITSQLKIIQTQDSLQKVAKMPETQRNALIASIIEDISKAESQGKTSQYSDRYNLGQYYENERRFQENIDQEGNWYFYNQTALTFGRTEFRRRWGDRPLADNWRRSNKAVAATEQLSGGQDTSGNSRPDTANTRMDYKNPLYYLKNLPMTDSLMSLSDEMIANAYLSCGKAYYEKLQDPVRACEMFEKLITRYPDNELVPEAVYNLYNVNKATNSRLAETYRQRLLEKYPDTEFARILSDPDYFNKKTAKSRMAEQNYEKAYNTYLKEDFSTAISLCEEALKDNPPDQLAPRFLLLKAFCVARTSDERTFKEELNNIIRLWPETEESTRAGEIIDYLNKKIPELKVEEETAVANELYIADTTQIHRFVLIIADPSFNINQANFDVISYNIDNYTNNNLKTQGVITGNKYIMITVSGFKSYIQSLEYYKAFDITKYMRNATGAKMYSFIINTGNLDVLNKDLNPERYMLFFKENYLK